MSLIAVGVAILLIVGLFAKLSTASKVAAAERERVLHTTSDPGVRRAISEKQVQRGMTEEQVIASWGQPTAITRQALKTKMKVTLRYGPTRGGSSVYLENGIVTGWKQST